jgi:twitching motility protein PilT
MAKLDNLLRYTKEQQASDLHLVAGEVPRIRIFGKLKEIPGLAEQTDEQLRDLMQGIVSPDRWQHFESTGDLDFAHAVEGVPRFRSNYCLQHRGAGAVFRVIPDKITPLEALQLPEAVNALADLQRGLVLITGPTGSGKSTTLAGIVDRINSDHDKHIVTIEDPIEFIHTERRCVFSQREVGTDTASFGAALRGAIREDADVILVAEMRDLETVSLAVTAAEMGSLVFGTLHTNSASKTIDRLIDVFPADQQAQIRLSLSDSLEAVISQHLLPTADGKGRCPAVEILLQTQGLSNLIREGNTPMIHSVIQSGRKSGMRTMDDSLLELVQAKKVAPDEAARRAVDKKLFNTHIAQAARAAHQAGPGFPPPAPQSGGEPS